MEGDLMTPDQVGAWAQEGEDNNFGLPPEAQHYAGSLLPPSQGRAPRDILKDIIGSDRGSMPDSMRTPTLKMDSADMGSPDEGAIFDRLNSGGWRTLGDATGTNAAVEGDLNYQRLQNERAKLDMEAARYKHLKDQYEPEDSDDPMVRKIAGAEKNRAYEDVLPFGTKPSLKIGNAGEPMADMTPRDVKAGAPSYGEARKEAGLEAVAGARGRLGGQSRTYVGPGSSADIGGQRIQLTKEAQNALHQLDQDQTLTPQERDSRRQKIMKRAAIMSDILSGKGAAGYFKNDFGP